MLNTFYARKNSKFTEILENKFKNIRDSQNNFFQKNSKIKPKITIINTQKNKDNNHLSFLKKKKLEPEKPNMQNNNNLSSNDTNKINIFYGNDKLHKTKKTNFSSKSTNHFQYRGCTPNNTFNQKIDISNSTKHNFFHFNIFDNIKLNEKFANLKKNSYEYFPDIHTSTKNNIDINFNSQFNQIYLNISKTFKQKFAYKNNKKGKKLNHNRKYTDFMKENSKTKMKSFENENSNSIFKTKNNENPSFGYNQKTLDKNSIKNISDENVPKKFKMFSRDKIIESIRKYKKANDTIFENEIKNNYINEDIPHKNIFNYYSNGVYLMKEPKKFNNRENPTTIKSTNYDSNNKNNENIFDYSVKQNTIENNENKKTNKINDSFKNSYDRKINEDINQKNKNNLKNDNKINNESSDNLNYKTSSYFFSKKFKKHFNDNYKNESNDPNTDKKQDLNDIINRVIENNKRAAAAKTSTCFYNIGINYMNNRARKTGTNFFANYKKKFAAGENNNNENKKYLNSIKLTLENPDVWKNHEIVWKNIQKFNEKDSQFLLPPNDEEVLVSCYLHLFPKKLKINSVVKNKDKKEDFFSFVIDDSIHNPTKEIQKWKSAHKKLILKWHPDKLFPIIKELKINEDLKNELKKRSTVIIHNINKTFQNIMEILKKILLAKEEKEKDNKF